MAFRNMAREIPRQPQPDTRRPPQARRINQRRPFIVEELSEAWGSLSKRARAAILAVSVIMAGAGAVAINNQINADNRALENYSGIPPADYAFTGDIEVSPDVVNRYSEFGGTPVPEGNTLPYRVHSPATDEDPHGGMDALIAVVGKDGKTEWLRLDFNPTDPVGTGNQDVAIAKEGNLVPIDQNKLTVTIDGENISTKTLGIATPDANPPKNPIP